MPEDELAITVKKIEFRRKLSLMERIWLPEILRGLWLTNRHFVVNICLHILKRSWLA